MDRLTPRIVAELLHHEGLVREAYRDSVGVWTWSVGITDASGHRVGRYRDNPQPIERCLEVFVWLLRTRYLPAVVAAFAGHDASEPQLAAALSFHWNTGAIARATWLKRFLAGDTGGAADTFLDWCRPSEVVPRRRCERDLFFAGTWTGTGTVTLYDVAKPSYRPVRPRRIDVTDMLKGVLAEPEILSLDSGPSGPPAEPAPPAPPPASRRNWFERLFG